MIYVTASNTASNGVTSSYHRIAGAHLSASLQNIEVEVESWPTETQAAEGMPPVSRAIYRIPISSLGDSASFVEDLKAAVVGPHGFGGGSIVPAEVVDLNTAKARKRAAILARRDHEEKTSTFEALGETFLSDPMRITGAAAGALAAAALSVPFGVTWTLANDTSLSLDDTEMLTVGLAQLAHADAIHQHARTLLAEVDAATTISEVDAVDVW
jgi:hypothetical protein